SWVGRGWVFGPPGPSLVPPRPYRRGGTRDEVVRDEVGTRLGRGTRSCVGDLLAALRGEPVKVRGALLLGPHPALPDKPRKRRADADGLAFDRLLDLGLGRPVVDREIGEDAPGDGHVDGDAESVVGFDFGGDATVGVGGDGQDADLAFGRPATDVPGPVLHDGDGEDRKSV